MAANDKSRLGEAAPGIAGCAWWKAAYSGGHQPRPVFGL